MANLIKDNLYDNFLKNPSRESFRLFMQNNCGELNNIDFKEKWIEKGSLAKIILAMANSRGGLIIIGVKEEDDGTVIPIGIDKFMDKADINSSVAKYLAPDLDYQVFDFKYDSAEYKEMENKMFQIIAVNDTPDRLPFISLAETTGLEKDCIYVRRGTTSCKASSQEISSMIESKIRTIFKETSDITLEEHLNQLKTLYGELPQKVKVLVKKGELAPGVKSLFSALSKTLNAGAFGTPDVYEEIDNPSLPAESYEAFISRMIDMKKLKIEKVLDLK